MPAYGVNSPPTDATKPVPTAVCKLSVTDLNFYYGTFQALKNISMEIFANQVTAFIGPSGCGKSTFLRTLNRMNETVRNTRVEGQILLDGVNILEQEVAYVRRRVGMYSSAPIRSRNPYSTTSPTVRASTARSRTARRCVKKLSRACAAQRCGMR